MNYGVCVKGDDHSKDEENYLLGHNREFYVVTRALAMFQIIYLVTKFVIKIDQKILKELLE